MVRVCIYTYVFIIIYKSIGVIWWLFIIESIDSIGLMCLCTYICICMFICMYMMFIIFQQIHEINSQVAQFRDLLINIGQSRDSPELRERVRKLRRHCVEACKNTSQLVLPQMRR